MSDADLGMFLVAVGVVCVVFSPLLSGLLLVGLPSVERTRAAVKRLSSVKGAENRERFLPALCRISHFLIPLFYNDRRLK